MNGMVYNMKSIFMKKFERFAAIVIVVILIAEFFLFNYKAFLIHPFNSSQYANQQFAIAESQLNGLSQLADGNYQAIENTPSIIFNLDQPVETMFLDASIVTDDKQKAASELIADIAYATESYKQLRSSDKKFTIVKAVPESRYVTCSYFGKVKQIQLTFEVDKDTVLNISQFSVNEKIPVNISLARIAFLFIISCLFYIFIKHPAFKEATDLKCRFHLCAVGLTIAAFLILVMFTYNMYSGDYDWWHNTTGDQMTQELVDAFANGQVSLVDEVPKELLELENPYDWSERINAGLSYKWDHLLFEGKYYSYYGIAPVLTLFLPYHMITGYYFSASFACLMYTLGAVLFLGLCYLSIVRNWFSKTPLRLTILGLVTTLFSSCVLINV